MTTRVACLIIVIVLAGPWPASKWVSRAFASAGDTRHGLRIRINPRKGPAYVEPLNGIGCSETICSRVFVRALVEDDDGTVVQRIRFDTIAALEMLPSGDARVRFNDGTSRRLLVASDNRVLYLTDEKGRTKRVDLSNVVSIEFLPRTPWGDPDLQGVWSGAASVLVPFDRDPSLGTRNVVTDDEVRARMTRQLKASSSGNIEATNFGIEPDLSSASSHTASLVIDPAD